MLVHNDQTAIAGSNVGGINIFEGARRIAFVLKVFCGLAVGFVSGITVWSDRQFILNYETDGPNEGFARVESVNSCDIGFEGKDHVEIIENYDLGEGYTANIVLCFKGRSLNNGSKVIPFAIESDGTWQGSARNSESVISYARARASSFGLSTADRAAANQEARQAYLAIIVRSFGVALAGALVAVAVISFSQWTIGWIVRGFLGISRRQDNRDRS